MTVQPPREVSVRRSFVHRAASALARFATSAVYRRSLVFRFFGGGFQPYPATRANRYPAIFTWVQEQLGSDSNARILSFGCATGEEVFTLRSYFPHAFIKGLDINPRSIAVCLRKQEKLGDRSLAFEVADSTIRESDASYDALFCMAVLRDGRLGARGLERSDAYIRFEDFARTVGDFSRCLKPGGLLVIRHSNFRFCDAPASAEFETVFARDRGVIGNTPIFGPDNRLLPGVRYDDIVFRKRSPITSEVMEMERGLPYSRAP